MSILNPNTASRTCAPIYYPGNDATKARVFVPFNPATPWINPDFECHYGDWWRGMVQSTLDANNKPVYNNPTFALSLIHSKETFDWWWKDFPAPHSASDGAAAYQVPYAIKLVEADPVGKPGVYSYSSASQFPWNEAGIPVGMGNYIYNNPGDGNKTATVNSMYKGDKNGTSSGKNFNYTYEIHTSFTYKKGQTFTFQGDDDVWVFIDKKLAIDIGGVHQPVKGELNLDTGSVLYTRTWNGTTVTATNPLNLVEGLNYQFDFFYCERHTTAANMIISTSIAFPTTIPD